MSCKLQGETAGQKRLRVLRTRDDWEKVTHPVDPAAIVTNRMGEQYPGRARRALRAFAASDASVATVPDLAPGVLQETIRALGLDNEIYAEQRGLETVLRRVDG